MKNKKNRIKNHYILILGICVLIGCAIFSAISVFNKVEKDDVNKSPLATNEILYTDIKNALLGKTELVTADDNDTDYEVL